MIDIRYIKEKPDEVVARLAKKGKDAKQDVEQILCLDGRRRALMGSFDALPAGSERCAHCELDRICDGGCAANNFLATGRLGEPPEVYCWWRRELLKWAKWIREAEKCRR